MRFRQNIYLDQIYLSLFGHYSLFATAKLSLYIVVIYYKPGDKYCRCKTNLQRIEAQLLCLEERKLVAFSVSNIDIAQLS